MDDNRRYYSLDALRGSMMMLGLVLHGSQWYISEPPDGLPVPTDPSAAYVFDVIVHFIRSFRMPLFFVLAGFFTSLLVQKRGLRGTYANRGSRILSPLLVSCLTILPLTMLAMIAFMGSAKFNTLQVLPSMEQINILKAEISAAGNAFAHAIYEHSQLPLKVFEAARIATAMINGCIICKNWRSERDVKQLGIHSGVIENGEVPDEAFYRALLDGQHSHLSQRERMAVEYANAMGDRPQALSADDDFWLQMKGVFSDAEITDLTYSIAGWMGMGRVFHVLGMDQSCAI